MFMQIFRTRIIACALAVGIFGIADANAGPIGPDLPGLYGKPVELIFRYSFDTVVETRQPFDRADAITYGSDEDGVVFFHIESGSEVVVDINGVSTGDLIQVSAFGTTRGVLGSRTFFDIYDFEGGALLQEIEYHTSASQPMTLGDQIGSVTLVGYVGEDGRLGLPGIFAVAEPTTFSMIGVGLAALGLAASRRKVRASV